MESFPADPDLWDFCGDAELQEPQGLRASWQVGRGCTKRQRATPAPPASASDAAAGRRWNRGLTQV